MVILPTNMVTVIMNFPTPERSAVMPILYPVVLYAETLSNIILNKLKSGSKKASSKTDNPIATNESIIIAKDLLTVFCETSLPKASIRFFPLAILIILSEATASVLVLIPPPTDAGEAPTHIKNIRINNVGKCSMEVSKVLKPDVLAVEPKNEVTSLPQKL